MAKNTDLKENIQNGIKAFCEKECAFTDGVLQHKGHPVKALVVVHVFGNLADMESIMAT